jgi:hypothetical protein
MRRHLSKSLLLVLVAGACSRSGSTIAQLKDSCGNFIQLTQLTR